MSTPQPISAFDLERTYVHLSDGPDAKRVEVTPDFWQTISANPGVRGGRFVTYGEGTQHRGL